MTPPLFLLDPLPLGPRVELLGDEGRHAARVKRLGVGEPVLVADGAGTVLDCVVTEVRPDGLVLGVVARREEPAPQPRLVVVQALPKGDRGELAVEVMTELGVDAIAPWSAARCVTQWKGERGERAHAKWQRTAAEAVKQSRRAFVPEVAPLQGTAAVTRRLGESAGALVLHEDAGESLARVPLPAAGDLTLVVGPEGGIADDELERFVAAGATPVRMGPAVLRTSTAGAAALAALALRLGRWG